MTAQPTDGLTFAQPTAEQVALLNQCVQLEAQRVVAAVTRLAATHLDMAQQIVHNMMVIALNAESFGIEAAAHVFDICRERGGIDEVASG